MPSSIAPGFVKFDYHSAAGVHAGFIPTRAWTVPGGGFAFGSFLNWEDGEAIDAETMIDDMVTALRNFLSETSFVDRWTIYTQATPSSDPLPRTSKSVNLAGVDDSASWEEAVQMTLSYRDTDFSRGKVVVLDAPSGGVFPRVLAPVTDDKYDVLMKELNDTANAWSSRKGFRPQTFISATWTLNEKLRRAYRLA